jgi:hypothetical protein
MVKALVSSAVEKLHIAVSFETTEMKMSIYDLRRAVRFSLITVVGNLTGW